MLPIGFDHIITDAKHIITDADHISTDDLRPPALTTLPPALTTIGSLIRHHAALATVRARRVEPGTVGICIGTRRVEEKSAHACSNK